MATLEELKARLAEAKAAEAASALTEEEQERIKLQDKIDKAEEQARENARARRQLDLATREREAREALGPKTPIAALDIEDKSPGAGTMILKYPGGKVVAKWERDVQAAGKNHDKLEEAHRSYVSAAIYDWNGITDLHGIASKAGAELLALLKERPHIVSALLKVLYELGGLVEKERKS